MTPEEFTNEILELRQDINLLGQTLMKKGKLVIDADYNEHDERTITDARILIQELTDTI